MDWKLTILSLSVLDLDSIKCMCRMVVRQASVEGRVGVLVDVKETNLFVSRRGSMVLASGG